MNRKDYLAQLLALLPLGNAWQQNDKTQLTQLLDAFAETLSSVDAKALSLVIDAIPNNTVSLLPEWERNAGLPDACAETIDTLDEKRKALIARLTNIGGQSTQFFIYFAKQCGYDIDIEEFRPVRAGINGAGDALTNTSDWQFSWRIHLPEILLSHFKSGISGAGEPLVVWRNSIDSLLCFFDRLKPSHTYLLYNF